MNKPLEDQLTEYHDIKAWLAGTKPSPAGRTSRRRMQVQIQQALPASVRGAAYALAPRAGFHLRRLTLGLFLLNMVPVLLDVLEAGGPASPPAFEALGQMLRAMTETVRLLGNMVIAVGLLGVTLSWVVAGE